MDSNDSFLNEVVLNSGFCPIATNIFSHLDYNALANCRLVSKSFKGLIDHQRFLKVAQLEDMVVKKKLV